MGNQFYNVIVIPAIGGHRFDQKTQIRLAQLQHRQKISRQQTSPRLVRNTLNQCTTSVTGIAALRSKWAVGKARRRSISESIRD